MTVSTDLNPNLSPSQILAQIYQWYLTNGSGGGSGYVLPIASGTVLGGIKIGSGLTIDPATGIVTASGGSGIPQGGPLTQNLDAGGFSILGFSDLVDTSPNSFESLFNGTGGQVAIAIATNQNFSSFFQNQFYDISYNPVFGNAVNSPSGLVGLDASGNIPIGTLGQIFDSGSGIIFQNIFSGSSNGFFANNDGNAGLVSNGLVLYLSDDGNVNVNGSVISDESGNLFSDGQSVSSLFDGTGGIVALAQDANHAQSSDADGKILHGTDGSMSGVASFQSDGSLGAGPTPIADGTYTVGLGVTNNGTITVVSGIITAIQEAS